MAGDDYASATSLTINGIVRRLVLDNRVSLLELLRGPVGLTGTKRGCDHGQCGACTVLMNGHRVNSCLVLAVAADGAEIVTVEGLASADGQLHPLQQSFVDRDAFQCGYCTPGQLCSALGMISEWAAGWPSYTTPDAGETPLTADEVRERMSGNLCRCGCYANIVSAILDVVHGRSQ